MGRGMTRFKTMRSFAKHRGGGRSAFLSKWKEEGNISVWFHTKELPMEIWRHQIPLIQVRDDRDDKSKKVKHVWSKNLVCHETVEVLEAQNYRDKETADRKKPPERCGLCKLIEWCYQQALAYEETRDSKKPKGLSFVTPIFHFEGDEPDETTTLHVGGMCSLFSDDDLSEAMKEDLKRAKISLRNSWKENAKAKCQYVMMIVDNAHPESGVQIAVETKLLGEKVKEVMEDELEKNDVDIQRKPYCIEWEYFEKEKVFGKKYKATALRKVKPSPRILALIQGDTPQLSDDLTEPFNQQSIRAMLERHCVLPDKALVPWDEIFPSREQEALWKKEDEEQARRDKLAEEDEEEEGDEDAEEDEKKDEDEDDEDDDEDEEMFACDDCGKAIKASDAECPHCGKQYEVTKDEDDEPKKPEPKMRTRAEVAAMKKGGNGKPAKKASAKKPKEEAEEEPDENDVPF